MIREREREKDTQRERARYNAERERASETERSWCRSSSWSSSSSNCVREHVCEQQRCNQLWEAHTHHFKNTLCRWSSSQVEDEVEMMKWPDYVWWHVKNFIKVFNIEIKP